jgi:hypothetical protein
VSDYRLQFIDDQRNVLTTLRLESADDASAVTEVANHHLSTDAELWRGEELVRTFRKAEDDQPRTRQNMVRHDGRHV